MADPKATLKTNRGDIVINLFPNHAPETVDNFVGLAEGTKDYRDDAGRRGEKYYDGLGFHRVIDGFMIQGGCPLGTGTGGPGYTFKDEIHPELVFDKPYLLAMANAGPGTNGSQFFITVGATPWLNRKHTIFGEVADQASRDVVDAIGTTADRRDGPPGRAGGHRVRHRRALTTRLTRATDALTEPPEGVRPPAGVPTCYRHPDRETYIRCQRCDKPICPDCMRDAAVGFQCPDCVKAATKGSRQNRAMYGGERSADPRLTTYVLIGINAVVWLAITATGGRDLVAGRPAGAARRPGGATWPTARDVLPDDRDAGVCAALSRRDCAGRRRRRGLVAAGDQRRSPTSRSGTSR